MISYKVILAIVLSISFLIIAPLVVLYAAGYQITRPDDQLRPEFQVTGGLRVAPPRRYQATLNQQVPKTTPFFTTGLKPGTITLTLHQSGYQSWQKDLPIKPHRVTMVTAPVLFPDTPQAQPLDNTSREISQIFTVPDKDMFLYVDRDPERAGLWMFFPEEELHRQIFALPETQDRSSQYKNILWSQDGQNIFFTISNENIQISYLASQILTDSQPSIINLSQEVPSNIEPLAIFGNDLFYQKEETIFKHDLSNLLSEDSSLLSQANPIAKNISTGVIKHNRLVYHSQADGGLYQYRISSQERERIISSSSVDFLSLSPDNQYLFFTNIRGSFVFNLQEETLHKLPLGSIKDIQYSSDRAIIQTSSQLASFYLQDIESYLTRSQGSIENIYQNDQMEQIRILKGSSEYALFIKDGVLSAIEFDPRDEVQVFPLLEAQDYHQYYDGRNVRIYLKNEQSLQQFTFPIREGGVFN